MLLYQTCIGASSCLDRQESLYADGRIYLPRDDKTKAILAFDVDDETITSVGLPTGDDLAEPDKRKPRFFSKIMELSGRPCVAVQEDLGSSQALWLLSADLQWVRRCLLVDTIQVVSLTGVWDCGGVLVLYSEATVEEDDELFVYNVTMEKMFRARLNRDLAPDVSEYAICWGYKPTLVSPGSIVGKLDQDVGGRSREVPADMVKALHLVAESDRKKGRKATLDTMCFMNILVCIMRRLLDGGDVQDLLEMLITED